MKAKLLIAFATLGALLASYSAYLFGQRPTNPPPAFTPAVNPYAKGIYANGIIESAQDHGANINIYPEVSGPMTAVLVKEGDVVKQGDPLIRIDDSVQQATFAQQQAQAKAAWSVLEELKAQPRPENLHVAEAQVSAAEASLKNVQDHLDKLQSIAGSSQAISRDDLDNARNAVNVAKTNLVVVQRQYELTKAGAWSFDVSNQEKIYESLTKAADSTEALLAKYTLQAPCDGTVLSIQSPVGSYVSAQGAYNTYTQGMSPLVVMSTSQEYLAVRVYVDEILVPRLPLADQLSATMFVRGTDRNIPLSFDRMQPYISPKVELADSRQERVDVRVLPMVFRFVKPRDLNLYPGQLVDVYISSSQRGAQ